MMNRNRLLNKYLLLAVIFIAMLAMSGCRTRITNNNEVSNVYYDEDGFLTETYQMRRDELGLSTAEKPILPDLGSGDTEDDFDSAEDSNFNYEPEEDNYVEPPTTNTTNNRTGTRGRTGTTGSGTGTNTSTDVKIKFDPGSEGTIKGMGKGKILPKNVTKGHKVSLLSKEDVTRPGHTLKGWKDSSGKEYSEGSSVEAKKSTTYTAVWKKSGGGPYTVVFKDANGKVIKEEKVESGKAAKAPDTNPKKPGYIFDGWDRDFSKVTSDMTINPKWKPTNETKWKEEVDKAIKASSSEDVIMPDNKDDEKKYIKGLNTKSNDDGKYVVLFESSNVGKRLNDFMSDPDNQEKYSEKTIIVVSKDALKGDLLYKIYLMNIIHGSGLDDEQALEDLKGNDPIIEWDTMPTYQEPTEPDEPDPEDQTTTEGGE